MNQSERIRFAGSPEAGSVSPAVAIRYLMSLMAVGEKIHLAKRVAAFFLPAGATDPASPGRRRSALFQKTRRSESPKAHAVGSVGA
jgi:hypothetical protein